MPVCSGGVQSHPCPPQVLRLRRFFGIHLRMFGFLTQPHYLRERMREQKNKTEAKILPGLRNTLSRTISYVDPPEIRGQKVTSHWITFRKMETASLLRSGVGEKKMRSFIVTRSESGKSKRIRNTNRFRLSAPAAFAQDHRQSRCDSQGLTSGRLAWASTTVRRTIGGPPFHTGANPTSLEIRLLSSQRCADFFAVCNFAAFFLSLYHFLFRIQAPDDFSPSSLNVWRIHGNFKVGINGFGTHREKVLRAPSQ